MSKDKSIIIGGMDEAGRGPAIGPIVFGLVLVTKKQESELKEKGIKDSKTLTLKQREQFKKIIEETVIDFATLQLNAAEIDDQRAQGINLNKIEVIAFKNLLKPFANKIDKLQLDAADVNEQRFGDNFRDIFSGKIISKHKGDSLFISVGAASILAKVQRDHEIIRLQEAMKEFDPTLPSFGSGYPTDAKPFLRAYVAKYKELPEIARKSWKTGSKILREELDPKQTTLDW